MSTNYSHWVSCWGNATSFTDRKEAVFAKDITLRYPVRMVFNGNQLRLRFSNLTGTETVQLSQVFIGVRKDSYTAIPVTCQGDTSISILAGQEITTDPVSVNISRGECIDVSVYLKDYTQMNAGTLITGPLSKGSYSYGNYAAEETLPLDYTRNTNWFYFLNTIDILTESENHALVCYGDSITAQSWPDFLTLRTFDEGYNHIAIIRRAVSGTRILRQYDCITYQAYGLKGATRFPVEINVAGATDVILQHGINDIIHPVGIDINPFRPLSDMPTVEELEDAIQTLYVEHSRKLGLKVWSGTLLPIWGWRTYNEEREKMRCELNQWLRSSTIFDGCIDFEKAVSDYLGIHRIAFKEGYDSGDHLHPSDVAYKAMAECVPIKILNK